MILPKKDIRKAPKAIGQKMLTNITAGLGLVAALAWNEAIKSLIESVLPNTGSGTVAKVIYAVIVTIIIGLVLFYMSSDEEKDK